MQALEACDARAIATFSATTARRTSATRAAQPALGASLRSLHAHDGRADRRRGRPEHGRCAAGAADVRLHVRRRRPGPRAGARSAGRCAIACRRCGCWCPAVSSRWCSASCSAACSAVEDLFLRCGCIRSITRWPSCGTAVCFGVVLLTLGLLIDALQALVARRLARVARARGPVLAAYLARRSARCSMARRRCWLLPVGIAWVLDRRRAHREDGPAQRHSARPRASSSSTCCSSRSTPSPSCVSARSRSRMQACARRRRLAEQRRRRGYWLVLLVGNALDPRARRPRGRHPDDPPDAVRVLHPLPHARGGPFEPLPPPRRTPLLPAGSQAMKRLAPAGSLPFRPCRAVTVVVATVALVLAAPAFAAEAARPSPSIRASLRWGFAVGCDLGRAGARSARATPWRRSARRRVGALAEKPDLFGRVLILSGSPRASRSTA